MASKADATAVTDSPALAAGLMVTSLFLLGLQDGLVKLTSGDVSLWQFQLLRALGNLALIAIASIFISMIRPRWPINWGAVALRSLFLVTAMSFFFGGVPFLTLSEIAAGLYIFPLFVTLLSAVILRERVGPRRIAAVLCGFAGALLILKPGTAAFQWVGLMPVMAAFCYASMILTTRKLCRHEHPATLAAGVSVGFVVYGVLGIAGMSLFRHEELIAEWPYLFTGWQPLLLMVGLTIFACSCLNLVSNIALAKAYQSAESSWLAPFDYSYLIFATFWGAVLYGDFPDGFSLAGMALIAGSGIYVAWRERQLRLKGLAV